MAHPIPFNRGLLMNVGFEEARLLEDYQCYIFHDVDLIPEDDRNLYTCPDKNTPRHMSVAVSSMHYRLPYGSIFGGVSAMTKEQFLAVNGFSNLYFGWGGEDDDLSKRWKLLQKRGKSVSEEGLSTLQYRLLKRELRDLYTWIYVDVEKKEVRLVIECIVQFLLFLNIDHFSCFNPLAWVYTDTLLFLLRSSAKQSVSNETSVIKF
ncbi:beta-1,4-N-acetylgalactosaminyltransferase bre-4-like isoform X2 [Liolophura sinensis]|uniref:beta-1,4-N-acetylgalactosaminyltransferase bre-4-like isoform X2 n=1 Tax=Liolophura sinensis TaxID=3198878 RepID=UPI003158C5CE